ncbi:NAD-dependent epimerase/dehydratase family protein [Tateyamaria sp. SN3-11]|uniref:NAD-dependent epimerase/dehydratase family protein n=1 Tax=Tateyamaria sp. SN3-11 TaxID=3092147 RepID=UPI0039EAA52B
MARYVVTGASGRIGSAIVRLLSADHHSVIGVDRVASAHTKAIGDIRDLGFMARVSTGADAVIHTAALHAPHVPVTSEKEFVQINVDGTDTVLKAMQANGVKRMVFTSTTALFGYASQQDARASWIDETTRPRPRTIYHRTKIEAEQMLHAAANADLTVRIIRMSRCFPEPAPLMALYRLHRGVDARDVAQAHVRALKQDGAACDVFIISARTPFHKSDAEALWSDAASVVHLRAPDVAKAYAQRGWDLPQRIDRVYDSARAQAELGWQAEYGAHAVLDQLDAGSPEVLMPDAAGSAIQE